MATQLAEPEPNRAKLAELAKVAIAESQEGDHHFAGAKDRIFKGFECYKRSGDALIEAKAEAGHGYWLKWLKEYWPKSKETAELYMKVARKWQSLLATEVKAGRVHSLNDARMQLHRQELLRSTSYGKFCKLALLQLSNLPKRLPNDCRPRIK